MLRCSWWHARSSASLSAGLSLTPTIVVFAIVGRYGRRKRSSTMLIANLSAARWALGVRGPRLWSSCLAFVLLFCVR
jgi:hypothetical protein